MKPGKILVGECSCRFLVVDVVCGPPPARLLVARCRDYQDASALAWAISEQTVRAELWYLHGNGKDRFLELLRSVSRETDWSNPGGFESPARISCRALVLPTKGLLPT